MTAVSGVPAPARRHTGADAHVQHGLLPDPIGFELERLAGDLGVACLLEGTEGRLISHALYGPAPECVVDAVLSRDASSLHRARGPALQAGVIGSGPIVQTTLHGWDREVCIIPVPAHGWLWVLGGTAPPLADCEDLVRPLQQALNRIANHATDPALLELLTREPSHVHAIATDQRVMVVQAMDKSVKAEAMDQTLRAALQGLSPLRCTATFDKAYVLLRSPAGDAQLRAQLSAAVRRAGSVLGVELCAVVSPPGLAPSHARQLAEQGLEALAAPNRCLGLDDCRPHILLPRLLESVREMSPRGDNLLTELDDTLATTLLDWLDHFGDTAAAASAQGVHPNTFRYRLQRAKALVGTNLDDPIARLELHLRLIDGANRSTRWHTYGS